jgi:predicted nucleotidyltransferase
MRKKRAIDALFPRTRRDILAATYGQPARWWYLTELAQHLDTTPSSLQRELESLVASGILRTRREGKRTYFQAEHDSPIFSELTGIVTKTLGVADALKDALSRFGDQIRCAFIHGSFARQQEHSRSDVDLIVIGRVGLAELSPPLRALERKFKREFNVTCYSLAEFRRKLASENHFVVSVLGKEKLFLKGDEDELARIAGRPDRRAA